VLFTLSSILLILFSVQLLTMCGDGDDGLLSWLLTELAPTRIRLPPMSTQRFSREMVLQLQEAEMLSPDEAQYVHDKIDEFEHLQQLQDAALALQIQHEALADMEEAGLEDPSVALALQLALEELAVEESVARDGQYARNIVSRHEARRRMQELGDLEVAKTREAELKCSDSTFNTDRSLAEKVQELERNSADLAECDAGVQELVLAHDGDELVTTASFMDEAAAGTGSDNEAWRRAVCLSTIPHRRARASTAATRPTRCCCPASTAPASTACLVYTKPPWPT
jgi:hypothetical protein